MKFRVLFLGYWNIDDGLTHSTIFPHLRILKELSQVEYVHFTNTQRESPLAESLKAIEELAIDYTALYSKNLPVNQLNKIYDFIHFPKLIRQLCQKHDINFIIARGAPAGSLAYLVWKKSKVPFIVESFEPHADYMLSAGEWKGYGLRYHFQKYWEKQQKKYALALITVAHNYKNKLLEESVNESKIHVAPCAVDTNIFYPDKQLRDIMREKHHVPKDSIVGVYAGKFGGLYLEEEAFYVFKQAFEQIENFHLILLTNTNRQWLQKQIERNHLPSKRILIHFVSYNEVNSYLNMSDFAFALYKSNHVSQYLSPVKIGEYWAVGLPVIITENLGDEQYFIEEEALGIVIKNRNWSNSILELLSRKSIETQRRNISVVANVYQSIFN